MSAPPAPAPVDRRLLTLLVVPIVAVTACSYLGSILMPTLIEDQPEVVIALNSVTRNLLLAIGADIAPAAFFVIGFLRLIVPDPLYFFLGREFGGRGREWMARQPGGVPWTITWVEWAFARADWLAVIVMPNGIVSLLAGMHRMAFRTFIVLNAIGTAARLTILWFLGQAFEEQLGDVVDFVARYQWWLVAGFVALTVAQSMWKASHLPTEADLESVNDPADESVGRPVAQSADPPSDAPSR